MNDAFAINLRNWECRVPIHVRDATGTYGIAAVLAGEDRLSPIEGTEIGDVAGLTILHLQCHIGLDTLCLAHRGATVTGLDFSPSAIAAARRFAAEARVPATFVEGNVYDAPRLLGGTYDMIFTTWGTITWLPDIAAWARVVATLLKPGGTLYFADAHPGALMLDEVGGIIRPHYAYRTPRDEPLVFTEPTTYTGDPTLLDQPETREWIHPISDIVAALFSAGLALTMLREHERLPWRLFPSMVEAGEGLYRLPDGHPSLPLALSLKARRQA